MSVKIEEISRLILQIRKFDREYEIQKTTGADSVSLRDMINLNPSLQRNFVWPIRYRRELITSIIMGWPIPNIILSEQPDGHFTVFDGKQRLSSICEFHANKFQLKDKRLPDHLQELTYDELPDDIKKRFLHTDISVLRITLNPEDEGMLFNRINNNTSKLSAGEKIVGTYAHTPWFAKLSRYATGAEFLSNFSKSARKNGENILIKAFAFSLLQKNHSSNTMEDIQEVILNRGERLTEDVDRFVQNNSKITRMFDFEKIHIVKLGIALGHLNKYSAEDLRQVKGEVVHLVDRFKNIKPEEIRDGLKIHTSLYKKELSLFFHDKLKEILKIPVRDRSFPANMKKMLLSRTERCAGCECNLNQRNAHADHVVPHSRGGETNESNLAILCEDCNRMKSNKTLNDFLKL